MANEQSDDVSHLNVITGEWGTLKRTRKLPDFFEKCTKVKLSDLPAKVVVLETSATQVEMAKALAPKIREHYLTEKILQKWGYTKIAAYVAQKTPVTKVGRSGDLGEILATEYINSGSIPPYEVPINRLRWKDSRELPMRGEDVVGFAFDQTPILFLKAEAKSRKVLTAKVVAAARAALEKNSGLPLPHTLSFIVERLYEMDQDDRAQQIEEFVGRKLPATLQVAHLIFTFSGNDPSGLLKQDAKNAGAFVYYAVGLRIEQHQELIKSVYDEACRG